MIFQAQVVIKKKKAIVLFPGQNQLKENQKYNLLISPERNKITFIYPPDTPFGKMYLAPCKASKISPITIHLTHQIVKQNEGKQQMAVVQITSSQQCITVINNLCPARRYKSCLSFTPSAVRHISILSGQSTTQKYRGFINLIAIMFVVLNLRNIFDNFLRYGARFLQYPLQFVPITAFLGFLSIYAFIQLAYRLEKLRFHRNLSDRSVRILLKVNQMTLLFYIYLFCRKYMNNHPISGISLTIFGLVTFIKLVSYMQVNTQILCLLERSSSLARSEFNQFVFANHEINQENLEIILKHRKDWQPLLSRKKLYYFLIAPTLCYQLSYPSSPPPRYPWLIKRITELIIISALLMVLWVQYMEPELQIWFSKAEQIRNNKLQIAYRLMRLSIPNTVGWIMGFYALFHLYFNIISQIIGFGDRNFYMDWWNCRNLEQYWKTWNLPVHFFFIRHCYTPLLKRGWSRLAANFLVFVLSAIAHQYLICVPLGVTSYYAFLAMMMQAPAIFLQKFMSKTFKLQNSELGNVSFWLFFCFLGQPTCLFIYYSLYMQRHIQ